MNEPINSLDIWIDDGLGTPADRRCVHHRGREPVLSVAPDRVSLRALQNRTEPANVLQRFEVDNSLNQAGSELLEIFQATLTPLENGLRFLLPSSRYLLPLLTRHPDHNRFRAR